MKLPCNKYTTPLYKKQALIEMKAVNKNNLLQVPLKAGEIKDTPHNPYLQYQKHFVGLFPLLVFI